jgi:hypothetical protein
MLGYLSSGWPLAYLIATAIFATGLLIGALVHVSELVQVAHQPVENARDRMAVANQSTAVGRISGIVDGRWAKDRIPLFGNDVVTLGRELVLESGLVEVTYNTGAKVILQGPVAYTVESNNGGLLALGKLTGKIITADAKGFSVRTPTATVTDLGTEFGVDVDARGTTTCTVFRGSVQVTRSVLGGPPSETRRVRQGECARIGKTAIDVGASAGEPIQFVRTLAKPSPARVLIPTADKKPAWWRYSMDRPADAWMQPDFDDSWWPMAKASFGCAGQSNAARSKRTDNVPRPAIVSPWTTSDLWLRQNISVNGPIHFTKALLTILHDNDVEVYVNGRRIYERTGTHQGYSAVDVTEPLRSALHERMNTVAAHVRGTSNLYQSFDLGLTLDPQGDCLPASLTVTNLTGSKLSLIRTVDEGGAEWQWTTDPPNGDWKDLSANIRRWKTGKAGFGVTDQNISAAMIGTPWKTGDLWLRKIVSLAEIPADYLGVLQVIHDDDAEVFVNGKQIFAEAGFLTEMKAVDVTERLKASLQRGPNIIAVHVCQKHGGQYIDLGLSLWDAGKRGTATSVAPAK